MHRDLLIACLPGLIALAVLFAMLLGLMRLSGARPRLTRLRALHACQEGGVQSLAFVLTLPVFLMIVLFIVQIALVMIGLITVNTAAFAAARSASVWIPAAVSPAEEDLENRLPAIAPGVPFNVDLAIARTSPKYSEIFDAAALACVPIAPSNRRYSSSAAPVLGGTAADEALVSLYRRLAPASTSNAAIPDRLRRKLAYALQNTRLVVRFEDKNSGYGPNSVRGPTYNPFDHPTVQYVPSEVGWQDPVTVEVWHHFALLPGPGRFLARQMYRFDGRQDEISPLIEHDSGIPKMWLTASATLTVEGLKPVKPYVQRP